MSEPKLVAVVEVSGNGNEDAWAMGSWHAKIEACKAAGITDLREVEVTTAEWLDYRRLVVTARDGQRYEARLAQTESLAGPTNLPGRTLRPGDPDWPSA